MKDLDTVKPPTCPNCKQKYIIKELKKEDGENFNFLIIHDEESSASCPFGLESYQNTIKECIESVEDYIKEEFPWKK